ncbi:hypothetical protein E8E11_005699 [Didymella keratinophila]|nr:hypothetical protein E8E11_005699 [Didymella keratinophila]
MSASNHRQPLSPDFLQRQQEYVDISNSIRANLDTACGELELLEQTKREFLRRGQGPPKELKVEISDAKSKIEDAMLKYEQAYNELKGPTLQRREAAMETLEAIKEMEEMRTKL